MRDVLATLPADSTSALAARLPHLWDLRMHDPTGTQLLEERLCLPGRMAVLLLRDPHNANPMHATDGTVTLETPSGRRKVTEEEFRGALRTLRPSVAVSLHDEVPLTVGHNRVRATVERSTRWLKATIAATTGSVDAATATSGVAPRPRKVARLEGPVAVAAAEERGEGSAAPTHTSLLAYVPLLADADACSASVAGVVAAVSGALPVAEAGETASLRPLVCGFFLGGLGLGEGGAQRRAILSRVIPALPASGVRVLAGLLSPLDMLEAVALGVDVFDSDYADALTRCGCAAVFAFDPAAPPVEEEVAPAGVAVAAPSLGSAALDALVAPPADPAASAGGASGGGAAAKGGRVGGSGSTSYAKPAWLAADATPVIDFRAAGTAGAGLARDARPILLGCRCFACGGVPDGSAALARAAGRPAGNDAACVRPLRHGGHRRAYIHHLVATQEMLGGVLLSAHNSWHMASFLAAVRRAVAAGELAAYSAWFQRANGLLEQAPSETARDSASA